MKFPEADFNAGKSRAQRTDGAPKRRLNSKAQIPINSFTTRKRIAEKFNHMQIIFELLAQFFTEILIAAFVKNRFLFAALLWATGLVCLALGFFVYERSAVLMFVGGVLCFFGFLCWPVSAILRNKDGD